MPTADVNRVLRDIVIAPRAGGSVVLDLRKGAYFELDETATEIVKLAKSRGAAAAARTLAARYSLPFGDMATDVAKVLDTLRDVKPASTARIRRPTGKGVSTVATQWRKMSPSLKLAAVYASALVLLVECLLHLVPLPRAARWMKTPLAEDVQVSDLPPIDLTRLSKQEQRRLYGVEWAYRSWLYDGTCLRRSLACGWVLRARQPRLCLGLTKQHDVLAHAWLVIGDHTLDGLPGAQLFSQFGDLAASGSALNV